MNGFAGSNTPVRCPTCFGKGTMPESFYIQGGTSTMIDPRMTCKTCDGKGVVCPQS